MITMGLIQSTSYFCKHILLEPSHFICLCIVYGHSCTAMTDSGSYIDHMPTKFEIVTVWLALHRKSLTMPIY